MNEHMALALRLMPVILAAIAMVEAISKGKSGPEKKAAALEAIRAGILTAESIIGRDLVDDATFMEIIGRVIDDYIAIANMVRDIRKRTA